MTNTCTPREAVIEAMARGIFEQRHRGLRSCHEWESSSLDDEHPHMRRNVIRDATAALDALTAALPSLGLTLVPVEATQEMHCAGAWNMTAGSTVTPVWRAMLAAAPSPLADTKDKP